MAIAYSQRWTLESTTATESAAATTATESTTATAKSATATTLAPLAGDEVEGVNRQNVGENR